MTRLSAGTPCGGASPDPNPPALEFVSLQADEVVVQSGEAAIAWVADDADDEVTSRATALAVATAVFGLLYLLMSRFSIYFFPFCSEKNDWSFNAFRSNNFAYIKS